MTFSDLYTVWNKSGNNNCSQNGYLRFLGEAVPVSTLIIYQLNIEYYLIILIKFIFYNNLNMKIKLSKKTFFLLLI